MITKTTSIRLWFLTCALCLSSPAFGFQTEVNHSTAHSDNAQGTRSTWFYDDATSTYMGAYVSAYFYEQTNVGGSGGPTSYVGGYCYGYEYFQSNDPVLGWSYYVRSYYGDATQPTLNPLNAAGIFTANVYEYGYNAVDEWYWNDLGTQTVSVDMTAQSGQPVQSRGTNSYEYRGPSYSYTSRSTYSGLYREAETINATIAGQEFPSYGNDYQYGNIGKGRSSYHYSSRY